MTHEFPAKRSQHILVVDDSPELAMLMQELLAAHGYLVQLAYSAAEAEREIAGRPPDLILLDVQMPGKNGYDLCRELKDNPETRLIPIVMITGLTDRENRIRGIESGADEFLNKPIFPEELFARVKSLLRLKEFTDELDNAEAVLCTLGLSVEARDPYTEGHCERLSQYASELGAFLRMGADAILALKRGGYLHDLGKIAIPDEILKKGSDLTADEWSIMRQHPIIGERICQPLRSLRKVLPIIRHHHEHWDGSGYPDQLVGLEIPLLARTLQVVDVYDALRTARPYKAAQSHEQARETMLREAERGRWDRELVRAMFAMLTERRKAA
ncbi:HD-GYP domain-containing protein [Candidatus Korobacter versatilis]|uniref:HD-GYP domain-containing protein n=1 Tax=Candidatus Korobacter versatilis TaxID=658062 RepID=UPI0002EE7478|nr:HD domain-containing phosphohydrolase [Candidatus Koribacter versatilis]